MRIKSNHAILVLALLPVIPVMGYAIHSFKGSSGVAATFVDQGKILQSDLEFMSAKTTGSDFFSKTKEQIIDGDLKEKFGIKALKNKFFNSELVRNGVRGAKDEAIQFNENGVDTIAKSRLSYIMEKKEDLLPQGGPSKEDLQKQADLTVEVARRKRLGIPLGNIEKGLAGDGLSFKEKLEIEKQRAVKEFEERNRKAANSQPINLSTNINGGDDVQEDGRPRRNSRQNRARSKKIQFYTEVREVKEERKPKAEKTRIEKPRATFSYTPMKAIIDQRLKVKAGDKVQIRLLADYTYKGVVLKRNTLLYGIASLAGHRAKIRVSSIPIGSMVLPADLDVYDPDGIEGIYINTSYDDLSKEVISEGLKQANDRIGVKIPLAKFSLKLGKKKNRESAAFIPGGYPILLYDPNIKILE